MSSRVFSIRHGETCWSLDGKHTGITDLPLTAKGEQQVLDTKRTCVGRGKLIDPAKVIVTYSSPRIRARRTAELLGIRPSEAGNGDGRPHSSQATGLISSPIIDNEQAFEITELLAEWDYGDYEGLNIAEVRILRKERGLDKDRNWNILKDGCEAGESPQQVSQRLDLLISMIKEQITSMPTDPGDVVCVAHGHIISALALRWVQQPLESGFKLVIDTAEVAVSEFEQNDMTEPAVHVGVAS